MTPAAERFPIIETARLRLRELRVEDAEDVFALFGDPEVTRYDDVRTYTDAMQARQFIARMQARNQSGETLRWAIALKDSDRLIGTGGFTDFLRSWSQAGLGYDLAQAYWGQGYMTEAVRAIVEYGFRELALNRIQALVVPENEGSARVLRKAGFREEGLLREFGYWKNTFWDLRLFARLKREFLEEITPHGNE